MITSPTKKKTMNRGEMRRMITSKRATSRLEETRNVVIKMQ